MSSSGRKKNLGRLAGRIESAIEAAFGFRPRVIVRTTSELRDVISQKSVRSTRGYPSRQLWSPSSPLIPARKRATLF